LGGNYHSCPRHVDLPNPGTIKTNKKAAKEGKQQEILIAAKISEGASDIIQYHCLD
jgi:hypothetical protein